MKNLFLFILFLIISISASTQDKKDVLFLKNGSIIRGEILENSTGIVKILSAGNLMVYSQDEIEKIDIEFLDKKKNEIKTDNRYYNLTTMGILLASKSDQKKAPVSVLMEHNFKATRNFSFGGVIGFEMLNETVVPLALTTKYCIIRDNNSLFFGITGGYLLSTEPVYQGDYSRYKTDGKGGVTYNLELGYLSAVTKNVGVYFAIGYRHCELNYKRSDSWYNNTYSSLEFNRISLRTGLSFF